MNQMVDRVVLVWYNSTTLRTPRLRSVGCSLQVNNYRLHQSAKFTGYQYGGRPLGLTFVKYTNAGNGDVMEGAEPTGISQDQVM